MIELKYENQQVGIYYDGKQRLSILGDSFTFGCGTANYKMSHGSFKFRDKVTQRAQCNIKECKEIQGGLSLTLDCNGERVADVDLTVDDGKVVITPKPIGDFNRFSFSLMSDKNEAFYGCGEIFSEFNLKGQKVNVWVAEHINALQIAKKLVKLVFGMKNPDKKQSFGKYETYYAQPTFMSSSKYFLHCNTTDFASFDFADNKTDVNIYDAKSSVIMGMGDDFESVLTLLTSALGRQVELPDWAFDGSILGIQGGTDIMMSKVDACLKAGAKVNGVWIQDWEGRRVTAVGKQLMWNWEYDDTLYHNLPQSITELDEKGIKVLGYINPFLAVEKDLYKFAAKKGYCVKDRDGKDYLVKITTFPAAMVDLTNPEAYQWIKSVIIDNMIGIGLSGWMADFGEYLPTDCVLYSGENPETVHNTWPALWAKVNREAVEQTGNLGKVFFFTRSGYTGTIKSSTMMWTGDQHVDYSVDFGYPSVIPATLGLCCSGYGLTHSDIGGYTTFLNLKRTPELFMRWCEMNAFSPLMRSHEGLNPEENAQFDANDEVMAHHARMSRIHAALKPYIKDVVKYNSDTGVGVMRPIFFYYDAPVWKNECTEYFLGRDVLVAPVLKQDEQSRNVRLPDDIWVDIWTGKEYTAGEYKVDAPFGKPPVYYKKDSAYSALFGTIKDIK